MKPIPDDHGGYKIQFGYYSLHFDTLEGAERWIEAKYESELRTKGKIRVEGRALDVLKEIERQRC